MSPTGAERRGDRPNEDAENSLLILTGFWPTRTNPVSGVFVVQQVRAFARAGIHVTVCVPRAFGLRSAIPLELAELGLRGSGVRLVKLPWLRLPETLSSLPGAIHLNAFLQRHSLGRALGRLMDASRIRHCIVHGERLGIYAAAWAPHVTQRCLVVMHGVDPYWQRANNAERARPYFARMSLRIAGVVLVGSPLRSFAAGLGIDPDRMHVVANGTELPTKAPASPAPSPTPRILVVVTSVSNLIITKGIDHNLQALSLVRKRHPGLEWEYRIIGDGPLRDSWMRLTEDLGLQDRVRFIGRLDYRATMTEMERCDIFSLPSWCEAFGIVYLEAMARAKPVIGCRENGPMDFVTHDQDGLLIAPQSVEDLAGQLERLLTDSTLRTRLGKCAVDTAARFTWDKNVERLREALGL